MISLQEAIAKVKASADPVISMLKEASRADDKGIQSKAEQAVNDAGMMEEIMSQRFASSQTRGSSWASDKSGKKPLSGSGTLQAAAIRAVAGTFKLSDINWDIGRVGLRYAKAVNARRPFMTNPGERELAPAIRLCEQVLRDELAKIAK